MAIQSGRRCRRVRAGVFVTIVALVLLGPVSSGQTGGAASAQRRVRAYVGITPNRFASEPNRPDVLIGRFNQTLGLGVSLLVGNSTWTDLEPRAGQYELDDLNFLVSSAALGKLEASFTLRVIDTIRKNVPADLQELAWNHATMKARVERLVEALAPALRGHVRWFMFGYEIDGYFERHPDEIAAFAELYGVAAARMKELVPGIHVGSTVTFSSGLAALSDSLAPVYEQTDVLALTYVPIEPNFTVKDPSVVPADFGEMKKAAGSRKLLLQEMAYPSSAAANGSEEKQAQFYQLVFDELGQSNGTIAGANFMMLADLSDEEADRFVDFYGMRDVPVFRALLQTLGMHDAGGRAKRSVTVFRQNVRIAVRRPASVFN